jgi:hypothetical protein
MGRRRRFTVYVARAVTTHGSVRFYVGCTEVLQGESQSTAVQRREQEHLSQGFRVSAAWLRCAVSVQCRAEGPVLASSADGYWSEIVTTVQLMAEFSRWCVRGGPTRW